jgi:phage terminase small subunit
MSGRLNGRVKAGTSKAAATARRLSFAHAYIANGRNGTRAAVEAGYSRKGADVAAARLLGDVRVSTQIAELTAELSQATRLTAERVLAEIGRLAFADARKLFRPDGTLKSPAEWDDDIAAAVASVEIVESEGEDGASVTCTKRVKFWDKGAALEKAMRHLGLFERDNVQRGESLQISINPVGSP